MCAFESSALCRRRRGVDIVLLRPRRQRIQPAGCSLVRANDLKEWIMSISVLGDTVYQGGAIRCTAMLPADGSLPLWHRDLRTPLQVHRTISNRQSRGESLTEWLYTAGSCCSPWMRLQVTFMTTEGYSARWSPVLLVLPGSATDKCPISCSSTRIFEW